MGGPFTYMQPASVLESDDPTAYRCGFNDWLDAESDRIVEIGGNYYDRDEAESAREEFMDGLDSELKDAEAELEAEEEQDEPDAEEVARLKEVVAECEAAIADASKFKL